MVKRNLSITEFLDVLQREFVVAEIRHKIYPKLSDKAFWEKVMQGKKEKIEDISFRNKMENIFNSADQRKRVYGDVYNDSGLPNFIYKDEKQRLGVDGYPGLEESDINCFYAMDSEVRVDQPGEKRFFGKVANYSPCRSLIHVKDNETQEVICSPREYVTRIL